MTEQVGEGIRLVVVKLDEVQHGIGIFRIVEGQLSATVAIVEHAHVPAVFRDHVVTDSHPR
jgi:hypothetical protein